MSEGTTDSDLERVLDDLEDYSLNARNYQVLQNKLDSVNHISASTTEKLLLLCIRDGIEDLKYTTYVLNIISTVLKKVKDGHCTPHPNLVPSALTVLNILKTTAQCDKLEALKTLCFEIINSYPDETLVSVGINHSNEIFEVISLYCHQNHTYESLPTEIRVQPINIVGKLLQILPPDKRTTFVKDGIKIWFSLVIPLVVEQSVTNTSDTVLNLLEALELLTDELVQFDYARNPSWLKILENIYTPSRYPAQLKSLLQKGSAIWHRIWIIFIKLLKNQITKSTNTTASPINALLPCVEMAFKLDVRNRCRAFLCWNVLIDNFSKGTNEAYLYKTLKLLMVPLTSNNAKVEETALAKFETWWHLITCFQTKLDKFLELVVIPFLAFCFGKPEVNILIPGKISDKTKVQCVQAFINIIGHTQCEGCLPLPKLNVQLLNTTLLVNYWRDWIHSLRSAVRICVEQHSEFTEKQIKCFWKSFIMAIGELPENNIRRDLFNEVLLLLEGLTQDCDSRLTGIIVNILIPTLFSRDDKIQPLLKSKDEQNTPIHKIIAVLNKLPLDSIEDRKTALENIKLLTNWMVEDAYKTSSNKIEWLVKHLSSNGVLLWTALADAVSGRAYSVCPRLLARMFLWPFNVMNNFANKEESTSAWLNLYKTISPYIQMKSIHEELIKALMTHGDNHSSYVFVLSATIAVLEYKLQHEDTDLDKEIELILLLTNKVNETQIKLILPLLAGVIVHTVTALNKNINVTIAEHVIFIINNILKICKVIFNEKPDNGSDLVKYIKNIFNSLECFFKLDSYSKLKSNLVDQLKECAPYLKNDKLLKKHILVIYKTSLNKNIADNIAEEVVQAFENVDVCNSVNLTPKQKVDEKKFTTPRGRAANKSKKKEASITDTVIENGEEFVVVKSHWKFNPRKLTENQKEKLQRKREDIPAMYQDLSQSQDDFKLTTWKTDSQDTSTSTSSKSTNMAANEDVSVILKNIPNSKFFPKIIENVTTKPVTNLTQNTEPTKEKFDITNDKSENDKIKNIQNTVKDAKSSRMTLKDRVFRNVRNLVERSNTSQECTDDTVNILKTPLIAKVMPSSNVMNSAPSQINSERPSRVRRKPKKFDDVQLITLTKKRHSLDSSDFQTNVAITENQLRIETCPPKNNKLFEDSDKANKVDSSTDNSKVVKGTAEPHGKGKLGEELTNCFVTENLNRTNDTVKKFLEKEKETACLGSKNVASSMQMVNEINEKIELISGHNDLNNTDKLVHDKIKDKVQEKMCTVRLDNAYLTPKSNKSKEKVDRKISIHSKKTVSVTPKAIEDSNEKVKMHPDENKTNAVPTTMEKEKTIEERPCPDSIVATEIEIINEKVEEKVCSDDNIVTLSTPKVIDKVIDKQILSNKKSNTKKSRIESQLAIDMVEGHPFLKVQSEKRSTRKVISNSPLKRKRLSFNPDNNTFKRKGTTKAENKTKAKEKSISIKDTPNSEDICTSQDFIESSQESAVTTISAKSSKPLGNKKPVIVLEDVTQAKYSTETDTQNLIDVPMNIDITKDNSDIELPRNKSDLTNLTEEMNTEPIDSIHVKDSIETDTQNLIAVPINLDLTNMEGNSDIELPCNKTDLINLTEEMDTEPIDTNTVVVLSKDEDSSLPVIAEIVAVEPDTQNTVDADTEPVDPNIFLKTNATGGPFDADQSIQITDSPDSKKTNQESAEIIVESNEINAPLMTTTEDLTKTLSESVLIEAEKDASNTACDDNEQRKKDFLNNTFQISPIKSMSPVRNEKSPSPETSSDYVVIKLASPVQSNGEPFEICESPEIFTEDKVSPDKRDQSPPREQVSVKSTSPSSSLSLKKNRPQMRHGGRAAQMLGLCVPESLQTMRTSEKSTELEETKRSPSVNTSARRNLRILYNSSTGESNDTSDDTEDSESFLKFKRTLPTTDCSPSGPILKRKLIEITDECTASPASKRKRVSFHDPPVSTTICVKKYIEPPQNIRSPQDSATKRLERQTRAQTAGISPRRLDSVFKLDSVLNKAVESFSDAPETMNEDTEMSSLDETPVVEVIKTSDLNDSDPICKELVNCEDHIKNIAAELSSPAMQALLVKKFEGKVESIGDLAKMTELEVNRLCIKAPKVQVAKKVLNEYLLRLKQANEQITSMVEAAMSESTVLEAKTSTEVQTENASVESNEVQTDCVAVSLASAQTDSVVTSHSFAQTNESGNKSTADIITDCLSHRPDFVERLRETLDDTSKQKITEDLPYDTLITMIMGKLSNGDGKHVLSILQDQLTVERFESNSLLRFCSNLLQKVCDDKAE